MSNQTGGVFYRLFLLVGCILLVALSCGEVVVAEEAGAQSVSAETEFLADGALKFGTQRITPDLSGFSFSFRTGQGRVMLFFWGKDGNKLSWCDHLQNRKKSVDLEKKEATVSGDFPAGTGGPSLKIIWGVRVKPDGGGEIFLRSDGGDAAAYIKNARFALFCDRSLLMDKIIFADGQAQAKRLSGPVASDKDVSLMIYSGKPASLCLPVGESAELELLPELGVGAAVLDRQKVSSPSSAECNFEIPVRGDALTFTLGAIMRDKEEQGAKARRGDVVAGIDFRPGGLLLPDFAASRNLIQNPGFELGFASWAGLGLGRVTSSATGDYFRIAEGDVYEGKRCLELIAEPEQTPAALGFFTVPVEAGRKYVFSFYAKSDRPGGLLEVSSHTAEWPQFPCGGTFTTGPEWKRFSKTFIAPNSTISIGFNPSAHNKQGARIRVDAVQLEAVEKPTEYTTVAAATALVTARRGNLLRPGENPQAALLVNGRAGLTGKIALEVCALDGARVRTEQLDFTLDASGNARLELPWAGELGQGMHSLQSTLTTSLPEGAYTRRDFHRFVVMPFLANDFKHHLFFSEGAFDSRVGSWPRWAELLQRCGIGSMVCFNLQPAGFLNDFAMRNVYVYSSIIRDGHRLSGLLPDAQAFVNLNKDYSTLTEQQRKKIEDMAYETAKANPQNRHWKTINEPDLLPLLTSADHVENMKAFVAMIAAMSRGIKRADPQMRVMTPDPANMYPSGGIRFIDEFLAAGGGKICDVVAIHPYRARPEDPDLDTHIANLLDVLKKHQFLGEVWFTEGIYHQIYQVPSLGLNVYQGCSSDHYRCPAFSYDLAHAERIAAAYTMRSWLTGLKYADRVKNYVDWTSPRLRVLDYDFTPTMHVFASNTPAALLGNADFRRDIEFGQGIRAYAFSDAQQRPVVALWTYLPELDRGSGQKPVLNVTSLPAGTETISFDGRIAVAGREIPLGPLPVFLRGPAGSLDLLCAGLEAGTFPAGGIEQLYTGVRLAAADKIELTMRNLLGRPQSGELRLRFSGADEMRANLTLGPREEKSFSGAVTLRSGVLNPVKATASFLPSGAANPLVREAAFDAFLVHRAPAPLMPGGGLKAWPDRARMTLPPRFREYPPLDRALNARFKVVPAWGGEVDLDAALYAAWDENNLYLAVDVRDDTHDPETEAGRAWQGDSVQIYLDCWGDARTRQSGGVSGGYGNDDQSFRVWADASGKLHILRDVAPEQQVAFLKTGEFKELNGVFTRTPDGHSIYEMVFPLREIQPAQLKEGAVLGLAVLINDRDGDYRKRAQTTTPDGTEPHSRPELFPAAILVK